MAVRNAIGTDLDRHGCPYRRGIQASRVDNTLDVGGTAALDLTRVGSRVFGTEDSWDELITKSSLWENWPGPRPPKIPYPLTGSIGLDPLTGSIGVGRVVETFIYIDLQGGAKDNFVDTLTFTTSVSCDANASLSNLIRCRASFGSYQRQPTSALRAWTCTN